MSNVPAMDNVTIMNNVPPVGNMTTMDNTLPLGNVTTMSKYLVNEYDQGLNAKGRETLKTMNSQSWRKNPKKGELVDQWRRPSLAKLAAKKTPIWAPSLIKEASIWEPLGHSKDRSVGPICQ